MFSKIQLTTLNTFSHPLSIFSFFYIHDVYKSTNSSFFYVTVRTFSLYISCISSKNLFGKRSWKVFILSIERRPVLSNYEKLTFFFFSSCTLIHVTYHQEKISISNSVSCNMITADKLYYNISWWSGKWIFASLCPTISTVNFILYPDYCITTFLPILQYNPTRGVISNMVVFRFYWHTVFCRKLYYFGFSSIR